MKNKIKLALVVAIVLLVGIAASVSVTGIGKATSQVQTTYSQGDVDTVKWSRERGVVGLAFALSSSDTVNIKNIIVKRVVNNQIVGNAVAVADTIAGAAVSGTVPVSAESSATAASFNHTITMTPYAEEYWVLVKYATGVTYKNGSGANDGAFTVKYKFIKQYSTE